MPVVILLKYFKGISHDLITQANNNRAYSSMGILAVRQAYS
jgi:hypothetical protein